MNGTMARLFGAAVVVSTLILGGCVGEAGDEEQDQATGHVTAADYGSASPVPHSPGGPAQGTPSGGATIPSSPSVPEDPSCPPPSADPEPSPWLPDPIR
jgi:hypothetical protein